MSRTLRWLLSALVAAGCVAFCLLDGQAGLALGSAMAFPFSLIGAGLRTLSLSGSAGNAAALGLYWLLSLLPLLGLLPVRRQRHWEDALLVLAVPVLLLVYWRMVNPGRLCAFSIALEQSCLGAAVWMLLLCWGVLRLLRSCFEGSSRRALHLLLEALGIFFVVAISGSCFGTLVDSWREFLAANTGGHGLTQGFLMLQFLVSALPYAGDLWVLASARTLLQAAEADRYSEATVTAAAQLASRCRVALSVSLLVQAAFNLLQLLCLPQLRVSSIQVMLPVSSVLFVLLVLLLSRQYAEGKQLKDDNDAFI